MSARCRWLGCAAPVARGLESRSQGHRHDGGSPSAEPHRRLSPRRSAAQAIPHRGAAAISGACAGASARGGRALVRMFRIEEGRMADLLFIVVTIVSFGLLIAFAYACDRL